MEHGPTTASSRSSAPCSTRWIAWRAVVPVASAAASIGSSPSSSCGGISARTAEMRRSSVLPTTVTGSGSETLVAFPEPDPCLPCKPRGDHFSIFISFLPCNPSVPHRLGEHVEQLDRFGPTQARVRDRHAVLERLARQEVLAALVQMTLDHQPDDAPFAFRELRGDVAPDLDLPLVLL